MNPRAAACAAVTLGGALAAAHPAVAQRSIELAAHPGVAYTLMMGSPFVGGWLRLWVTRTKTVAVGGEIGAFTGGGHVWSIQAYDPVFGRVALSERREHAFWLVRGVVRYRLPPLAPVESYAVLGTGFYGLHERLLVSERTPQGVPVRVGDRSWESHSLHPGAGAGLELGWQISPDGWLLLGDLGLHSIFGAAGGFYPVLVGSIGVAKKI